MPGSFSFKSLRHSLVDHSLAGQRLGHHFICFIMGSFVFLAGGPPLKAVQVAFFRQYTPQGQLVRYEPHGSFAHIAISYQGQWLHAHPYGGVQLSPSLESLGMVDYFVLQNPRRPEPSQDFVKKVMSQSFDIFSPWSDKATTYCSKLVGQFFNIPPQKMKFDSQDWKRLGSKPPQGQMGLSPDDIFRALIHRGFSEVNLKQSLMALPNLKCSAYLK